MWEESGIIIEGVDMDKLVRYLGKYLKRDEILEKGSEELFYSKVVNEKKRRRITKKISRKVVKIKKKKKIQDNKTSGEPDTLDTFVAKKNENNDNDNDDKIIDTDLNWEQTPLTFLSTRKLSLPRRRKQNG